MPITVLCPGRPVFQGRGASAGHLDVNFAAPQPPSATPAGTWPLGAVTGCLEPTESLLTGHGTMREWSASS